MDPLETIAARARAAKERALILEGQPLKFALVESENDMNAYELIEAFDNAGAWIVPSGKDGLIKFVEAASVDVPALAGDVLALVEEVRRLQRIRASMELDCIEAQGQAYENGVIG